MKIIINKIFNKIIIYHSIVFGAVFFLLFSSDICRADTIRRFAFIAGANDGGVNRTRLLYAVSDANSVLKVLREMGGVLIGDSILLTEPDRKGFLEGMNRMKGMVNKARPGSKRLELIFYYSGHSDEEALLLGKDRIYYREIKDYITRLPVDVRIAILDSCSSGAFTRLKGGKMKKPFLIDSAYNMKGYAFMTSSSMDEASQESDRIRGSFFTHYLLSGLRGAADMSQDRRITLNEAYQFAYDETLAGTEKTASGPQHPNYNIQMSGTGDVVMTDIRKSSSIMVINKDITGRLFIRDNDNNLVCELRKPGGRSIQFGLEHGEYTVINLTGGKVYEARIKMVEGEESYLAKTDFKKTDREYTVARGDDEKISDEEYRIVTWDFSLIPVYPANRKTINYYYINLLGSYSGKLDGLSIGVGPGIVAEDVRGFQVNVIGNYAGTTVEGAQVSSIFNIAGSDVTGAQVGGVFAISGDMKGAQISNVFNVAKGNTKGAQLSCVFNYAGENCKGSQISGVFNLTKKDIKAAQVAGVFNYSGGETVGAQISGVFNYAGKDLKGAQVAGVANIASDAGGMQIGCVNIADEFKGLQLGIVNIAKTQNGLPVGLINVSETNGGIEVGVWGSNLMAGNAGILFRSNYVYTVFSAGWMNLDEGIDRSFSYGIHLGAHIPAGRFYFEADAGAVHIDNEKLFSEDDNTDQHALQGRLMLGYDITERLSVFAGGGLSYIFDFEYDNDGSENRSNFNDGKYSPLVLAGVRMRVFGKGM